MHYHASLREALQKDSLAFNSDVLQNFKTSARLQGFLRIWLEELRHEPKVEVCLHRKRRKQDTSLQAPLVGLTSTEQIRVVHKSE